MSPCECCSAAARMKALMRREFILVKRNLVVYKAKVLQVVLMALVTATLFLCTHIHPVSPTMAKRLLASSSLLP